MSNDNLFFVNLQCNYGQFLKSLHYETPISRFSADCSRLLIAPFLKAQSHADKILKDEITSDLKENILSFWEKYSVDPSGGFYGSLGRDGAPIADAPKGGVLNARILWTFSTAYRMYGDAAYRKLADRRNAIS